MMIITCALSYMTGEEYHAEKSPFPVSIRQRDGTDCGHSSEFMTVYKMFMTSASIKCSFSEIEL